MHQSAWSAKKAQLATEEKTLIDLYLKPLMKSKLSFELSFLILVCVLLSLQLALNSIVFTAVPSIENKDHPNRQRCFRGYLIGE